MSVKKRSRKRRANLGSAPSQHREEANHYLAEAQSQIRSLERHTGSCLSNLHSIVGAERSLAKAAAHTAARGGPVKYKTKWRSAVKRLHARLDSISEKFERNCMR